MTAFGAIGRMRHFGTLRRLKRHAAKTSALLAGAIMGLAVIFLAKPSVVATYVVATTSYLPFQVAEPINSNATLPNRLWPGWEELRLPLV